MGKRRLVKISASADVVSALSQMRKNNYEELLIEPVDDETPLVFSGYSIISRLLDRKPSEYGAFLKSPCLLYCLSAGTVGRESDLLSLFHVFETTTFGFAMVHDEANKIISKITISDMLPLFHEGLLSSDLVIDDVASSPVFSMSRGTKITDCMREMENRKFRKVRVGSSSLVISDREIFSYLFDEKRLQRISENPQHLLDGTLEDLDGVYGEWIDGKKNISLAASLMARGGHRFLLPDKGIITAWDVVIKPWRLGQLRISSIN